MRYKERPLRDRYALSVDELRARIAAHDKLVSVDWQEVDKEERLNYIRDINKNTAQTLIILKEILEDLSFEDILLYSKDLGEQQLEGDDIIELCASIARLRYYIV